MNEPEPGQTIELIDVANIRVLNPRTRNRRMHQEIVRNIESVGLKRPITVCRTDKTPETGVYDLVCGQGRLEAFMMLGQRFIPAQVITASEQECLVKSLVENLARRQARPIEVLESVTQLRLHGYSNAEIGRKIGCSAEWVKNVELLLEKGEKRLLCAVEAGYLPLSLAVEIARAPDADCQNLLVDAYDRGELKGKKLVTVRRILERRAKSGKAAGYGIAKKSRSVTYKPEDLRKMYEAAANEHKRFVKSAELTQRRLMGVTQAFRELLQIEEFVRLLSEEKHNSMPQFLREAVMHREGGAA
ncbi:plasmid partitioning protein RepB C-terminal domain-containing protein [Paraburkholderia jirisanensis]